MMLKIMDSVNSKAEFKQQPLGVGTYYLWTVGCQMNKSDSERLGVALNQLGLDEVHSPHTADLVILNSCVVRQGAEDKVVGALHMVRQIKEKFPSQVLVLMGCMVGPQHVELKRRFPFIDLFLRPQEYAPLLNLVGERLGIDWEGCIGPLISSKPTITSYIPIIHGCDLFCSFCIIPYRRGRQQSRPIASLREEVEMLVQRGVREVTLLGQTVDAYGADLEEPVDLADLFYSINEVSGLERIRFLTSHPSFMSDRIIEAIANLPKVCENINLPIQAGDDTVLKRMRRTYTSAEYLRLIEKIRKMIPNVSLATDVIVGFCGETEEEFQNTYDLLELVQFDKVHVAAYSTRPGTIAARKLEDTVPAPIKSERLHRIEVLQEKVSRQINSNLLDQTVEVLVEGKSKGKWKGRSRTDKLVFFENEDQNYHGDLVNIQIVKTGPWSLQGVQNV